MLGMFTGTGPVNQCSANGPDKLDLGTIIEAGDKGCVVSLSLLHANARSELTVSSDMEYVGCQYARVMQWAITVLYL